MFKLFHKEKKPVELCTPVTGKSIAIETVPDKVFANKMMGDGVAFSFEGNQVCAPCDGKIVMIADTLHAFGMEAVNGAEILIHIGMDTVELNGKGFTKLVEADTKVKKGDPIIQLDRAVLKELGVELITPMVVTNGDDFKLQIEEVNKNVTVGEDIVITIE